MSSLIVLIGAVFYIVSYFTYGKSLERNVVRADGSTPTPAIRLRDNVDYLPAHKFVLFGHHFASIAGAGPIVGPAIAVVWGWFPALLWVWFGNLFRCMYTLH
jgi:carbon starvation protein